MKMSSANKLKTLFASKRAQVSMAAKEIFLDDDGVLYILRLNGDHQLIVPDTLVHEVIK